MISPGENVSIPPSLESCPNCSSPSFPEVDLVKAVSLGLVLGVFVLCGILGNILVILSVVCHSHLRSVTHYFIANLAAADLLLSSTVLPFSATSEVLGRWVFGRTFCNAWAALDVLCCTASILSLCVISVDRYLAVSYPLRYPAMATSRRGLVAVVILWGLSAIISVGPLFGWKEPDPEDETECRITEEPGYALFSALGSFYVPLAVILVMYCRVYVVARRESRGRREGQRKEMTESGGVTLRIHCGSPNATEKQGEEGREGTFRRRRTFALMRLLKFSREKKAAKTLGIVVGCFVLCWLPFFLVLPIGSIFPSYKPSETVFKIAFWLGYLNSCFNPIIYPCFSQEFKKAFLNVLRCRCFRRGGPGSKPHIRRSSYSPGGAHVARCHSMQSSNLSTDRCDPSPENSSQSWVCCRTLCTSSSSIGERDRSQSPHGQRKNLLKVWCFTARKRPLSQPSSSSGSIKILNLSTGVPGEAV